MPATALTSRPVENAAVAAFSDQPVSAAIAARATGNA